MASSLSFLFAMYIPNWVLRSQQRNANRHGSKIASRKACFFWPRTRKQTSKTKLLDNNCSTPAKLHRKTVAPSPCQQWQNEGLDLCPQEDVRKPIPNTPASVVSKTRQGSWTFTSATWQQAPVPRREWGLDFHHHLAVRMHPSPSLDWA